MFRACTLNRHCGRFLVTVRHPPQPFSRCSSVKVSLANQWSCLLGAGSTDTRRLRFGELASATHPYAGLQDTPTADPLKPIVALFSQVAFYPQLTLLLHNSRSSISRPPLHSTPRALLYASTPSKTSRRLPKPPATPNLSEESRRFGDPSYRQLFAASRRSARRLRSVKSEGEHRLFGRPGQHRDIGALDISIGVGERQESRASRSAGFLVATSTSDENEQLALRICAAKRNESHRKDHCVLQCPAQHKRSAQQRPPPQASAINEKATQMGSQQ